MKTFLEWLSQEFTILRLFDEIDDNEDFSIEFTPKNPSYYILCLGGPENVKIKFRGGSIDDILIYESDSPMSKSSVAEIVADKFDITLNQAKKIKIHQVNVLTNGGDFVSFLS